MITVEFKDYEEMKAFAIELLGGEMGTATKAPEMPKKVKAEKQEAAKEMQEEMQEEPDVKPEPEPEETTKYSLEDVRGRLAALNKAGKRTAVHELLGSFGAAKLSEISSEHYEALMKKTEEL
ncbi:MAG: hypothetical protein RSG54_10445 [Clostridium sp.]